MYMSRGWLMQINPSTLFGAVEDEGMRVKVLRAPALCYYLLFGSLGDLVLLATVFLCTRAPLVLNFLEDNYSDAFLQAALVLTIAVTYLRYRVQFHSRSASVEPPSPWRGLGKPLLFPCRTTHARLFPEKHSFAYSYLLVGIPVGWTGVSGGMVSSGRNPFAVDGWYHVDAADYLERGSGHLGLRGKLHAYLESQGIDPSRYPHAYLVTAAKFLGYHFNPVSFWYLYSAEKSLAAIVLEVNNTFDERRMYFLSVHDDAPESIGPPEIEPAEYAHQPDGSNAKPLRGTWPKDFHVSPFNSRKGTYSLTAHDPLLEKRKGRGPIDNTINLISSKNHAKLVARIFSEGDAIDPAAMTFLQRSIFLARWWWVGLVTFPRIVKEAALLFFRRKLHVWYRPEPLRTSIGRHADAVECRLEPLFRRYLKHLVQQSPTPLVVRYVPSGIADALPETMEPTTDRSSADEMEFKVLTPAFYSRFVHYAHDFEAIFSELNENNTIWVSKPDLLPKLFIKKDVPPPLQTANYLEYGCFTAIKKLRRRPERIERPLTSSQLGGSAAPQQDIRGFRLSAMDGYVLAQEDSGSRQVYRNSVLMLFIADRIAMGSVGLLQLGHWIIRLLVACVAVPPEHVDVFITRKG
ncbi:hypothetical protein GGS23DRAFT_607345 [Durotheca rogersii]|uniref:uncharacterized protein n=1 Tax=Durotheca rogersii TaxID=419775 RepID=UPI00221E7A25|nr:uncharacterized protein GGS23DRAFT_607345 [Durotheca rogersii]KAI5859760.1 hypothetical protein GGS23DRAFT_607345 [Durotheca rogersii]